MAHTISSNQNEDVKPAEDVTFESLNLSNEVITGLRNLGFVRPSPVQLEAIPLGRCGLDLVIQSKAGTGKTLVFSTIALENIDLESKGVQVIVVAPTREIAFQNAHVIHQVGSTIEGLQVQVFIGGLSLEADQKKAKTCNIAVGTPGRLRQMIENKTLDCRFTRLFVLDEADKLMEESFLDDITWIFTQLPVTKQVIAASATYPKALEDLVVRYMKKPSFVRIQHTRPALLGLRQFVCRVPFHPTTQQQAKRKLDVLLKILKSLQFDQCMIFTNLQTRAETLAAQLTSNGFAALCIVGSQNQTKRLQTLLQLRQHQCRILVATDLAARGIDSEYVNLVIQMDLPRDAATYLHRVGRAGRFGSAASAVGIFCEGNELTEFRHIISKTNSLVKVLAIENISRNEDQDQKSMAMEAFYDLWDQLDIMEGSGVIELDVDAASSPLLDTGLSKSSKGSRSAKNKKKEKLAKYEEICDSVPSAEAGPFAEKNNESTADLCQNRYSENNSKEMTEFVISWTDWYYGWLEHIRENKSQIESEVYQDTLCQYLKRI